MWSSVTSSLLCSKPRAGHCMINLGCSVPPNSVNHEKGKNDSVRCTLLVFGGSDCCGTFYNDTVKCTVEIPVDKWQIGKEIQTGFFFLFLNSAKWRWQCFSHNFRDILSMCYVCCMCFLTVVFVRGCVSDMYRNFLCVVLCSSEFFVFFKHSSLYTHLPLQAICCKWSAGWFFNFA